MADDLINLDVNEILNERSPSDESEQTTDQAESSTAENKSTEKSETPKATKTDPKVNPDDLPDMSQETEGDDVLGDTKDEPDDDKTVETEEEAQKKTKDAEARKAELNSEIRDLVAKRNTLRAEVEQTNAQAYRTQTEQELVTEGMDPSDARIEAQNQKMQMIEFNAHVADLNANLNIESLQLMNDFPEFDPNSPHFNEKLWDRATKLYANVAKVQRDPRTGLITEANVLPYEFYKAFAETSASSGQQNRIEGQLEGQKAAEKNLAAAETPSSSAPKAPKVDPFLAGLLGKYKK